MTGIALALTLFISAEASDDNTASARAAFQWAQKLYKEARYASAIEKFEEAYRLKPHPSILFNIGRCYEQLGEIPRALRSYRDYLKAMPDAKDKEQVTSAILNLERRLKDEGVQQLIVYTDPSGAFVTIDDKAYGSSPAAVELRPGNHLVKITLEGYAPVSRNFVMSSEKSVELSFALKADAAKTPEIAQPEKKKEPEKKSDTPTKGDGKDGKKVSETEPKTSGGTLTATSPQPQKKGRLFTWVAGGVAVAGLLTGIALGATSAGATGDMRTGEPKDQATVQALHDKAQGTGIGADVSYGVAGAAAITAVILFFVEGSAAPAPAQGAAGDAK